MRRGLSVTRGMGSYTGIACMKSRGECGRPHGEPPRKRAEMRKSKVYGLWSRMTTEWIEEIGNGKYPLLFPKKNQALPGAVRVQVTVVIPEKKGKNGGKQ